LLEVSEILCAPVDNIIRFIVTGYDVIHSFALPSLGIKIDAVPGKHNSLALNLFKVGMYYGMCSEICGTEHAFMPINLHVGTTEHFLSWCSYHQSHLKNLKISKTGLISAIVLVILNLCELYIFISIVAFIIIIYTRPNLSADSIILI
jgi:cytochrome c oxidase subunit 2